jgi:hypothetical protein
MGSLDRENATEWKDQADQSENALWLLWDDSKGAYLAANEVCRQVDVWGNAFLVTHGIGDKSRQLRVAQYLANHYPEFVHRGQVRHLPEPERWDRLFVDTPAGTYQNGGYWGTASGWMIKALSTVHPALAKKTLDDLISSYMQDGILEWIALDGRRGPDLYVATIANAWSLLKTRGPSTSGEDMRS